MRRSFTRSSTRASARSGRCRRNARRKTPGCCPCCSDRPHPSRSSARQRRTLFVLLVRLEYHLPQLVLRADVDDGTEQCEAATLAVDAVLTRGKRDVPAG